MKTKELTYHLSKTQFNVGYIENTYYVSSASDCLIIGAGFNVAQILSLIHI